MLTSGFKAQLDLTYVGPVGSGSKKKEADSNGIDKGSEKIDNDANKQQNKRDTAFDQLVLPEGHKEMVVSLIAQHFRDRESTTAATEQFDIVRGKGIRQSLLLLLNRLRG